MIQFSSNPQLKCQKQSRETCDIWLSEAQNTTVLHCCLTPWTVTSGKSQFTPVESFFFCKLSRLSAAKPDKHLSWQCHCQLRSCRWSDLSSCEDFWNKRRIKKSLLLKTEQDCRCFFSLLATQFLNQGSLYCSLAGSSTHSEKETGFTLVARVNLKVSMKKTFTWAT